MTNHIEISFCIPTYNNIASAKRLILNILEFANRNIEVIVLDNGSTDDTLEILNTINDTRLKVYSNGINKGALFNMINVLDKGQGKYLTYCTDHDHIDNSKIEKFRIFLQNNSSVSCGYCEYASKSEKQYELFESGYPAISKLGYITRHPTGFFFRRDIWKLINPVERFSDFELVDLFPLEFVFAEATLIGDGAIYHDAVFSPERGARVIKHKSSTTNGKSKSAFFSPLTRLKLAVNFDKHLRTLNIPKRQKQSLIFSIFYKELVSATLGFKSVMFNDALCAHYYMEKRVIGKKEIAKIALEFYDGYTNRVIKVYYKSYAQQVKFKLALWKNLTLRFTGKALSKYLKRSTNN